MDSLDWRNSTENTEMPEDTSKENNESALLDSSGEHTEVVIASNKKANMSETTENKQPQDPLGDIDPQPVDVAPVDPELEEIKQRVREMEAEAEKLKQMQSEVEEMNPAAAHQASQFAAASSAVQFPSLEEKIEADARSIYVGQVCYSCTAEEVELHFRGCGALNRVTILCDKFTGHPKGFCYIEFADKEAVETAMALDGSTLKNRQIKVMPKRTNKPGLLDPTARGRGRGRGMYSRGRGRGAHRGMRGYGYRGMPRGRGRGMMMPTYGMPY